MDNDNRAGYGRIGFTVFAGALALAAALIYLAGVGSGKKELLVETYYDHPVSGLSVGSAVNMRGVKVGEVKEIAFTSVVYEGLTDERDSQRVSIVISIDLKYGFNRSPEEAGYWIGLHVKRGLRATIASNAVTGMSRVEFNIVPNSVPPDKPAWTPRHLLIPPQPSLMEDMSDSITKALHQFNQTDFKSVWSNVSSVAESAATITRDVSELVARERLAVGAILRNVESASASLDELSEKLKRNPSLLLRENDPEPLPETAR